MKIAERRKRLTREESQALTRERLLESAGELVVQHGTGASVRDIADAAGYTQGALYAHFQSKELLFLELLRRHMAREAQELDALLQRSGDKPGGAMEALDGWLNGMNSDHDWSMLSMELQLHARRDKTFAAYYDRLFAQHKAAMARLVERFFGELGLVPPAAPIEIAGAMMALAHGMVLQRGRGARGTSDPAGATIKLLLKGLIAISAPLVVPER